MITFIGDVHGKFDEYKKIVDQSEYSIQVGDFGFSKAWRSLAESSIDPKRHVVLGGNHDDYDYIIDKTPPHYLGSYGTITLNNIDISYIRGASSIDRDQRTIGVDWWEQEQIPYDGMGDVIKWWVNLEKKPEVVVTHDCPRRVKEIMIPHSIKSSRTNHLLEILLDHHSPKLWIFGHYHKTCMFEYAKTKFICLDELDLVGLNKIGGILTTIFTV